MLISTKGRYALRVLIDLAEQPPMLYVPLKAIATRQEISEKYLESILRVLVKGNILTGLRGKGGGYRLLRSPDTYTVASILNLTEDSLAPVACLEEDVNSCERKSDCRTLAMWTGLDEMIQNYLSQITIADLINPDATSRMGDFYTI